MSLKTRLIGLLMLGLSWLPATFAQTATFTGNVTNSAGQGLCAMVLINGQYMFSCDGQGSYELTFPLDANGQATVFSFVDGLAPYRQVVTPTQANTTVDIGMSPSGGAPTPVVTLTSMTNQPNNHVGLAGHVRNAGGTPLCAMVLANGQYMFSCGGEGQFNLSVPRAQDDSVTLFTFVDGMSPFRLTFTPPTLPPPVTAAEGLWLGSTSNARGITGLILDDGALYMLYSVVGSPNFVAGVIQGNGSSSGSTYTSSNARDFNVQFGGVTSVTLSAGFVARQSLSGNVTHGGQNTPFSATYSTDYELTPSLAALAGTFNGDIGSNDRVESASIVIALNGTLSAQGASGCMASGTVTPRARGNVFNLQLQFGGSPCVLAGQVLNGIAYYDAGLRRLYATAPNAARSDGVLFVGGK